MQSKLNTLLWSILASTVVVAQEVRIESVLPMENGAKTSLVIAYSGSEKLTYFALDATKGVLTLDLPGVYSDVDFSQLQFAQVRAITQVPLNPDSSEGISLSFFLREGVVYSMYEGNPNELIILFEDGPVQAEPTEVASAPTPVGDSDQSMEISGLSGPGRLANVQVETADQAGVIQLTVAPETETRSFYLSGPRRFVLDLKETICSLDRDSMDLDSPLVKRVRIRQFQVEPTPVTRLVLDLESRTEVQYRQNGEGIQLAFGPDEGLVAAILEQGGFDSASGGAMVASDQSEPTPAETGETETVATEPMPQTAAPIAEEAVVDESDQPQVAVSQDPAPQLETEKALPEQQPEAEMQVAKAQVDPAEQAVTGQDTSEQPQQQVSSDPGVQTPPENAQEVALDDQTPSQSETVAEPDTETVQTQAVSSTPIEQSQSIGEDQAPLVSESQQAQNPKVVADVESGVLEEDEKALFDSYQDKSASQENTVTLTLDAPHYDDMAEIDEELAGFLGTEAEKTPYNLMKKADIRRPVRQGPILMNNATVDAANQQLAEMSPLQDEMTTNPEDLESIFAEPEAEDNFETLSGDQKKYRGFEIDSIDVKNVQVIDLLRFLASQINVNLYIDPSVSSNLTATYKFTNLPWDLILDMILNNANLDKEFSHGVLRVATVEKFRREAEQRRELQLQRELAVPVETVHIPLSYAKAADVEAIVRNYLSPRGLILRDDRTNTLIIEDIPKRMLSIRALIKKLDKMISQVTIEARVVETTKRFLRELGIQWGLSAQYSPELGNDTGLTFPNRVTAGGPTIGGVSRLNGLAGGYAVNFPVVDENPSGIGLSFGNFLDNFKLDISLQMLEDEGSGRIISAPKVTTQNNKTATIQNGQRIPIQTIQRGTITIRYIDATLQLLVTPHITADETIIMDIVVDKSEPDFTRTVAGNPVINIRKADTRVLVKNGGTAVIGGIFSINEQNTNRGIPKLRNIPVLRRVFSNERIEYTNQELLIFVTPRIVKY